jgi:ActR/RegA family two-component response regulator
MVALSDLFLRQATMQLNAILITDDEQVTSIWQKALAGASIDLRSAPTSEKALEALNTRKFEAVIIDMAAVLDAADFIARVRASRTNAGAVVFAVVGCVQEAVTALHAGASFTLDKPLSTQWIRRCLRAAHTTMVSERRRYQRFKVDVPCILTANGVEQQGTIANVSEGGIAVLTKPALPAGTAFSVRYCLPALPRDVQCDGTVVWTTASGLSGVRVVQISHQHQEMLRDWLADRLELELGTATAFASESGPPLP